MRSKGFCPGEKNPCVRTQAIQKPQVLFVHEQNPMFLPLGGWADSGFTGGTGPQPLPPTHRPQPSFLCIHQEIRGIFLEINQLLNNLQMDQGARRPQMPLTSPGFHLALFHKHPGLSSLSTLCGHVPPLAPAWFRPQQTVH